jgi:hypothetical protein
LNRALACLVLAACARSLDATARVPHPLTTPSSETNYALAIEIRDIKQPEGIAQETVGGDQPAVRREHAMMPVYIPPRTFLQAALLEAHGPDEVRIDLLLTAEWRELARIDGYKVELRDDAGELVAPEEVDATAERHRDYQATYQAIKKFQTAWLPGGEVFTMWGPEEYYVQERVWRGGGAVVFRRPGLLRVATRSLTLTLHNRARTMRFTWLFASR